CYRHRYIARGRLVFDVQFVGAYGHVHQVHRVRSSQPGRAGDYAAGARDMRATLIQSKLEERQQLDAWAVLPVGFLAPSGKDNDGRMRRINMRMNWTEGAPCFRPGSGLVQASVASYPDRSADGAEVVL